MNNQDVTNITPDKNEIVEETAYDLLKQFTYVRDFNNRDDFYVKYPITIEGDSGNTEYEAVDRLSSPDFKAIINSYLREELDMGILPNINGVYYRIYDEIRIENRTEKIYSRFAGNEDENIYFFADEKNTCLKMTAGKMKFVYTTDYFFYKNNIMVEQAMPKKSKKTLTELLKPYVNVSDDCLKLFIVYLCHLFIYDTSHMICIINSTHGSGKSTLTKLIKKLLDPTLSENTLIPSNVEDLKNHCANNTVVCFDNTRPLKDNESDILCAAVTGSTVAKRKLYSTSDEVLLFLKNIVILNGIDIVPKRADFVERSLMFELKSLANGKRKTEKEFWDSFEQDKPYILYDIFETISKAMSIKPTIDLNGKSHRMYDAFTWMCSIAVALGYKLEEFQKIFFENTGNLQDLSDEQDNFVNIVIRYINSQHGFKVTGKMTDVYNKIKEYAGTEDFPQNSSAFSRKMNEKSIKFEELGYRFDTTVKKDATYITLMKKGNRPQLTKMVS